MDKVQFIEWMEQLAAQPLTEKLKYEIILNFVEGYNNAFDNGKEMGYLEAKHEIVEYISNKCHDKRRYVK